LFSIKEFSAYFISLVLIGFGVFHYTLKAVSGSPVIFALIASLLLNILIFKKGSKLGGKKKLIMSVLLNLSLVPFSVLIVDLYFLPRYQSVTIGGGGALDSILVSTLWAVLITMSIILVLLFFENSGLNEKFSVAKKGSQKEIS
ncbi:MAG: hypothetical protein ACXWM7_07585, partial [Parachlamydiaceae bacterium]